MLLLCVILQASVPGWLATAVDEYLDGRWADPRARHANGRLVMLRDRKVIASIAIADISYVAVHGPITFTGPAIARLLDAGIDVTLHASAARLRGVIHSHDPKNVFLTLAQVAAWNDPARRLTFARVLLASEIPGRARASTRSRRRRPRGGCPLVMLPPAMRVSP